MQSFERTDADDRNPTSSFMWKRALGAVADHLGRRSRSGRTTDEPAEAAPDD
jgi:hypothetical protein